MNKDINQNILDLKDLLLNNAFTCVVLDIKNNIITSSENGIKPLIKLAIRNDNNMDNTYIAVADKVIGSAAAAIIVHLRIKNCYGELMSETAMSIFDEHNITYSYKNKTKTIMNRDKTDLCPMEKMTFGLNAKDAYNVLREFFKDKI